ncbi:uncharacterized protein LOC115242415 [Formica exsecta]|uniref:uncharacterized protein LOC115242415 n=1 Tax=Formica exsecta TaxID=72781 RepID=UPI0011443EC6|nr:uncharacterized protein LOC115242415 [Formica exsecta]
MGGNKKRKKAPPLQTGQWPVTNKAGSSVRPARKKALPRQGVAPAQAVAGAEKSRGNSQENWKCGVGIAAEPYRVPEDNPCWATNNSGSVAITWRMEIGSPPCSKIRGGRGHVAVEWGSLWVVGCYILPSTDLATFGEIFDEIELIVQRRFPEPIMVAGDFNAKSRHWGSRQTNRKGGVLEEWAAVLGLGIVNQGSSSTLVCPQGESIIDLTWASPSAADRISNAGDEARDPL